MTSSMVEPVMAADAQGHNASTNNSGLDHSGSSHSFYLSPSADNSSSSSDDFWTSEQETDPFHTGGSEMEVGLENNIVKLGQVSAETKIPPSPSSVTLLHEDRSPPCTIPLSNNNWVNDSPPNTMTANTPVDHPERSVGDVPEHNDNASLFPEAPHQGTPKSSTPRPRRRITNVPPSKTARVEASPEVTNEVYLQPYLDVKEYISKVISPRNLKMLLWILLVVQLLLVGWHTYNSFRLESRQSKCKNHLFQMLPITALRILSRFILPGAVYLYFYLYVIRNPECRVMQEFVKLLLQEKNRYYATEFMKRFIDPHSNDEAGTAHHLKSIQSWLTNCLKKAMVQTVISAAFLMIVLLIFVVVGGNDTSLSGYLVGILDILSFCLLQAMCGIIFSLIFISGRIKHYILAFRGFCSCVKLKKKAQSVDNFLVQQCYPLNKLVVFLTIMYSMTLFISWSSGIPLTCGISLSSADTAELTDKASLGACWLVFMVTVGLGQFLGVSPYSFHFGCFIFSVEAVILVILFCSSKTLEWAEFVHLLYAVIPLTYLLWYHIQSIPRQWTGARIAVVPDSRIQSEKPELYLVRFLSRSMMIVLIALALLASGWTEHNHMTKSGTEYISTAVVIPPFAGSAANGHRMSVLEDYNEAELAVIRDYIHRNCLVNPKSIESAYMPHRSCLYLDPTWAQDKTTHHLILRTVNAFKALLSVMDDVQHLEED